MLKRTYAEASCSLVYKSIGHLEELEPFPSSLGKKVPIF